MADNFDRARYEQLVERLLDLRRREPSLDHLSASADAIHAVLGFLNADPRLVKSEPTNSLGRLRLALHDRIRGAKPRLFFDPVDRMAATGPPSYTSAAILRAFVNAAFLSLHIAGMSRRNASRWLAAELKRSGIKQPNGDAVDARAIARWGVERGGKSLKGSDEMLAMFVRGARSQLPKEQSDNRPLTQREAKLAATSVVKLLKIAGF
jgi:hypothetical protein